MAGVTTQPQETMLQMTAEHAASVFHKTHRREGVGAQTLFLHANNGSPMKDATMLATRQKLGGHAIV